MITRRISARFRTVGFVLLGMAAGCGSSDDGDGGTGPTPAIAISIGSGTLTIQQGGSQDLIASITRSGGYTGIVTVETEGAPAGVSAATSGITTTGTTTTGTVTVTVAASVTPGTYNLVVRASGQGVTSVTAPVTLTVPPPPTPVIAISLSAAGQGLDQGKPGAAIMVTIARTNEPGVVHLALTGAPAGLTAAFDPLDVTGTTSSMTLTASTAVPEGTYNMTVKATSPGAVDVTAPFQVVVSIPASYAISVPDLTINQSDQVDVTVTMTRVNHASPVTLSLENAPAGVTGSFNPSAPIGNRNPILTIKVGAATPPGPHVVTVRGTTTDLPDVTTTFTLTVIQQAAGTYSLDTQPIGSVSVSRGGGGMAFVATVQRSVNFTQDVTLTVTGAPAGLTITPPVGGSTANRIPISVSAAAGLPAGPYHVTLTGTTPNLADRVVNLTVVVNLGNLSLDYSSCPGNFPLFVAAQDGKTGPWIRVIPQNSVFLTRLSASSGGIAAVFPGTGGHPSLQVQLGTADELEALSGAQLCGTAPSPGSRTATVSVGGLGALERALVSLGGVTGQATPAVPNPLLSGIPAGAQDLVAVSLPDAGGFSANKYIYRPSINPPDGGMLTVDFSTVEALDPVPATATITGLGGGETLGAISTAFLSGPSCTASPLWSVPATGNTAPIYGLQPSAGGVHRIAAAASGSGTVRSVEEFVSTFADRTIALGSGLPAPSVATLSANYRRLKFDLTLPADLTDRLTALYGNASITASAGWLGGTAASMAMPDFILTAGWDDSFGPSLSVQSVNWILAASGPLASNPCAGGRDVAATRTGVFVP